MEKFLHYLVNNWDKLLELTFQHILMVLLGLLLALVVGIPLGIISARYSRAAAPILAFANVIQVIPSLALLAVLMIIFGLGFNTVVIGLFLYSLLPIIRNTYVGLKEVDESITQAGKGVGMTAFQLLYKVQFPLSLPFIIAGIRIAAIIAIGVAALAPFIGGEGLGREIYAGINLRDPNKIYAGALVAALLAILSDFFLGNLEKRLSVNK